MGRGALKVSFDTGGIARDNVGDMIHFASARIEVLLLM